MLEKSWAEDGNQIKKKNIYIYIYMLLLLSRFSRVQLCATQQTAAHQALPSLGFSRQEHWSGVPFPSPMHEREKWKWSRSVMCRTLSDTMDCSLPGFSAHGIFQARVLEYIYKYIYLPEGNLCTSSSIKEPILWIHHKEFPWKEWDK